MTSFLKKGIICSISFLSLFSFVDAQNITSKVNLEIEPEFPGSGQSVTATASSNLLDLDRTNITWILDGREIQSGIGEKEFVFNTGDLGDLMNLEVVVSNGFGSYSKELSITPAEVDLVLESDSYKPFFYKGKTLNASQAKVRIVAIPHFLNSNGSKVSASNLIYKWNKDWKVLSGSSGFGKNSLSFDEYQYLSKATFSVEVSTVDGSLKAKKYIEVASKRPEIVFYKNDPLLGVLYNNALSGTINLAETEINIKAEPFFFSNDNQKNLTYKWIVNNKSIPDLTSTNNITLRQTESEGGGEAKVSLSLSDAKKVLQTASTVLNIKYGSSAGESIFGGVTNTINSIFNNQ